MNKNMKKIYSFIVGLLGSLAFVSCDDFLTVESPDQLNSENFWRNASDVEAGLAACYSQMYLMTYSSDKWSFAEVKWPVEAYREDIVSLGSDAMNYPNWVELYLFTYSNGNSQIASYWQSYYRGISFSNQIIEKTKEISNDIISETEKNKYINEGRFMRGFYHMQLLLNWEEIIIRDKYITDPNDLNKNLSSREEAWKFIVEDFKAATNLPQEYDSNNIGRATCGAAYSYLGWAYLTMAYEYPEKEEEYLNKALQALNNVKGYELEENFLSMFDGTNKNSKESIFEIQFSMNTANGASYRTQFHKWMACSELGGWDEILPTNKLLNEFKKEGINAQGNYDSRLYETIFYQCDYFNNSNVYGMNYDDWFNNNGTTYNKPVFRKFLPSTLEELEANYCAINVPLMRYANVLLMKAEILNKQGFPEQAIPLINEVRSKHGDMPAMKGTSQDEVQKQIEHERMIEFPLENMRWYDLRRWGKLSEELESAGRSGFTESKSFYPTPLTEINSNESLSSK